MKVGLGISPQGTLSRLAVASDQTTREKRFSTADHAAKPDHITPGEARLDTSSEFGGRRLVRGVICQHMAIMGVWVKNFTQKLSLKNALQRRGASASISVEIGFERPLPLNADITSLIFR